MSMEEIQRYNFLKFQTIIPNGIKEYSTVRHMFTPLSEYQSPTIPLVSPLLLVLRTERAMKD